MADNKIVNGVNVPELFNTLAMQRGLLLHVLEQSWMDSLKQFVSSPTEVRDGITDDAARSLRNLAEEACMLSGRCCPGPR